MLKIIATCLLCSVALHGAGQKPLIIAHDVVDVKASFPGGDSLLQNYIQAHLILPDSLIEKNISSTAVIKFYVDEQGHCSDFRLLKKVARCAECDERALNLARTFQNWNPGIIDKKAVNSYAVVKIAFNAPLNKTINK
jgi:periplasmic protein TonB